MLVFFFNFQISCEMFCLSEGPGWTDSRHATRLSGRVTGAARKLDQRIPTVSEDNELRCRWLRVNVLFSHQRGWITGRKFWTFEINYTFWNRKKKTKRRKCFFSFFFWHLWKDTVWVIVPTTIELVAEQKSIPTKTVHSMSWSWKEQDCDVMQQFWAEKSHLCCWCYYRLLVLFCRYLLVTPPRWLITHWLVINRNT